jgi:hypothetical protein
VTSDDIELSGAALKISVSLASPTATSATAAAAGGLSPAVNPEAAPAPSPATPQATSSTTPSAAGASSQAAASSDSAAAAEPANAVSDEEEALLDVQATAQHERALVEVWRKLERQEAAKVEQQASSDESPTASAAAAAADAIADADDDPEDEDAPRSVAGECNWIALAVDNFFIELLNGHAAKMAAACAPDGTVLYQPPPLTQRNADPAQLLQSALATGQYKIVGAHGEFATTGTARPAAGAGGPSPASPNGGSGASGESVWEMSAAEKVELKKALTEQILASLYAF